MNTKSKKKEVIKHNSAIRIEGKTDLLGRKAWNILLANSFDDLPKSEEYEIKIKDLYDYLDYKSRNDQYLKEILEALMNIKVKWDILNDDSEEIEWGRASLLSQVSIRKGVCKYAFAPIIRKKLYNPITYSRINLEMQNKFKSSYALVLYELAKSYYIAKKQKGNSPLISIDDFRNILGLAQNEYSEFKILNRAVLKPSIGAINKFTDIKIKINQKREGRKVGFLQLEIEANSNYVNEIKFLKNTETEDKKETLELESNEEKKLHELGFSVKEIGKLKNDFPDSKIIDSLDFFEMEKGKGQIRSPKRWLLACLNKDFDMGELEIKRKRKKEQEKEKEAEKKKRRLERIAKEQENKRKENIENWIKNNQEEYKKMCEKEFEEKRKNDDINLKFAIQNGAKKKKDPLTAFMESDFCTSGIKNLIFSQYINS